MSVTPEELEIWRHWNVASRIARTVQRYVEQGESLDDLQLIEEIQAELKAAFPVVETGQ